MNLTLFPPAPPPAAPPAVEPKPSDVKRRIEHKAGPFPILRTMTAAERDDSKTPASALIVRTYQLVELVDGRVFAEFENGERRQTTPDITPERIDSAIHAKTWREVSA